MPTTGPQDGITYQLIAAGTGGATNLVTNPKAFIDTAGWTDVSLTSLTRVADAPGDVPDAVPGETALRAQGNAADDRTYASVAVTSGVTYRFSAYVYLDSNTATGVRLQVRNASDTVKATGTTLTTQDTWTRLDVSVTADATATFRFGVEQVGAGTTDYYITGVLVQQTTALTPYFDGDTVGGSWTGTAGASTSTQGVRAVFNDPNDPDYVGMARFTGLDDAEVREVADDRTEADGGVHGNFWKGRRPIVMNVEVLATSTTDRNTKVQKMRRASNALRGDSVLTFTPDGGVPQFVRVRKNGPMRRSEDPGWLAKYSVPLISADPLIYGNTLNKSTGSSPLTVTNAGDADTYPIIRITGPAVEPVLVNEETGQTVAIRQTIPSGQYVDLDMHARTAMLNGSSNIYGSVAVDASTNDLQNTGSTDPDSATSVAGSGIDWATASNAADPAAGDATLTGVGVDSFSDTLRVTDFDFAIPTSAQISGISVGIVKRADHGGPPAGSTHWVMDSGIFLRSATIAPPDNRALGGYWGTSDSIYVYGGQYDLWGSDASTVTPTEVNDVTFGVDIGISVRNACIGRINYVAMTVYYQVAPVPAPAWFPLFPGSNEISVTEGTLSIDWRDAWL